MLLPALTEAAKSSAENHARINASSLQPTLVNTIDIDVLEVDPAQNATPPFTLHLQSKLVNLTFVNQGNPDIDTGNRYRFT